MIQDTLVIRGAQQHNLKNISLALPRNQLIVIEHNLDVIKTADWIIDLGPEGDDGGGQIVAQGTPEEVAHQAGSYTGQFLRQVLDKNQQHGAHDSGGLS